MSDNSELEGITQESLNELKDTILRWIERLGESMGSLDDKMAGAGRLRAYYDFLREIEAKLKTFETGAL